MRARSGALSALALITVLSGWGAATSPPVPPPVWITLKINFAPQPGLLYSREGGSSLSVSTAAGLRGVKLGGVVDASDPHYWSKLNPVRLRVSASGPSITVHTRLYVCDQVAGLCSVRERDQEVPLGAGSTLNVTLDTSRGPGL
jgi:hypothetical protein